MSIEVVAGVYIRTYSQVRLTRYTPETLGSSDGRPSWAARTKVTSTPVSVQNLVKVSSLHVKVR